MKLSKHFHETATSLAMQRRIIYGLMVLLGLTVIFLLFSSGRDAVVIDRDAYGLSVAAQVANAEPTDSEIKAFVPLAMADRFDSERDTGEFISDDEKLMKAKEVVELKRRDIWQKVLVESVSVAGSTAKTKVLRIVRLGELASAIPAQIEVKLARTNRSSANPFGLKAVGFQLIDSAQTSNPNGGGK